MSKLTEEEKVDSIILNTVINGMNISNPKEEYNYWIEALKWAKSDIYFSEKTEEEILHIFRKYETWNDFEEECNNLGHK